MFLPFVKPIVRVEQTFVAKPLASWNDVERWIEAVRVKACKSHLLSRCTHIIKIRVACLDHSRHIIAFANRLRRSCKSHNTLQSGSEFVESSVKLIGHDTDVSFVVLKLWCLRERRGTPIKRSRPMSVLKDSIYKSSQMYLGEWLTYWPLIETLGTHPPL